MDVKLGKPDTGFSDNRSLPAIQDRRGSFTPTRSKFAHTFHDTNSRDTNDAIRLIQLQNVWTFNDLHNANAAPEHILRIRAEVKHLGIAGGNFLLINNIDENVDVY